ncbi:MAG TPA: D-alanyl-D-alanine carboxypeptidase/D-alanyl-D-alanine-endopeptidase [Jatrophihabitantaceae bacterium]
MGSRIARITAYGLLPAVLAAGAALGGFELVHHVRIDRAAAARARSGVPTPAQLAGATRSPSPLPSSTDAPQPTASGLSRAIATALSAPDLGTQVHASVLDATSGAVLADRLGTDAAAPASTAKLLTAAAVVATRGAGYRISTRVVTGTAAGTVVLLGAGDPTLTGAQGGADGAYPDAARLSDLAGQLRAHHVGVDRIVVDDGLFTGPSTSPAWAPDDVPTDYAAPITAVMADGGRAAPGDVVRSSAPDLAAGRELAAALGVPSAAVVRGGAPSAARTLATVNSAPVSELVTQMLLASDNVIAECLARQVAIASGQPASFAGAVTAIRSTLTRLGADPGAGMRDGSGLAASDRLSTAALAGVLDEIVRDPALHVVLDALPVSGWSGTLADRYQPADGTHAAAGLVRAKTGTLTGVSSLAGVVHDTDGRLLVFAFIADRVPASAAGTAAADSALDRVAFALQRCGCR